MARQKRRQSKNQLQAPYERFTHYLGIMHQKALELLNSLNEADRNTVSIFFDKYYPTKSEHYWSVTKLFCHAMYIPMFLQIGKKHFPKLVYIDTHSGPGLAKIGDDEKDIVLGSPLIALHWPRVVAENVNQFRNIEKGFTELYFIDISFRNTNILRRFVAGYNNVKIYTSDANIQLPHIKVEEKALVYMFVDPYGDLSSQLSFNALKSFIGGHRVDIMMSVFAAHIARGLSGISNEQKLRDNVGKLFGKGFCESECSEALSLCHVGAATVESVLVAYRCALSQLGYTRVEFIPVPFGRGILYYMMLATRGSGEWVNGYIEYINKKAPKDYETLRALWLEATGRQKSLLSFLKR